MNSSISIVKLSKQAGHILPHLTWLPQKVLETINRFPYHSARLFAVGMDYVLNKQTYYTEMDSNNPIHFLSSSSYSGTLNIREFVGFIPTGTTGLLLSLGSIAEQAMIDNKDLKKMLVPGNQSVQLAINQYHNNSNVSPRLEQTDKGNSFFDKPSKGKIIDVLYLAIDAGASNLAGLKECYLVASYYERAYNRANLVDNHLHGRIDKLDYDLPPFPDKLEIKNGDRFIFDKPGVSFEKHWPDILLRDGKYSIVHHRVIPDSHIISTPNTSDFDDVRMAQSRNNEMACFILCKRNGKWGAVYSNGLNYFFILIVPYIYDTLEDVALEVNKYLDFDNKTKWLSWDDFKGLFHHPYE